MSLIHSLKGRLLNHHRPGDRPDVFLFSTARSGSTFLMEVLAEQRGMKVVNEPLQLNYPHVRRSLGWETWGEAATAPDRRERFKAHFTRIRENRIPLLNQPPYRRGGKLFTNRITFKILHGGEDLVDWFEDELGAAVLVLTRHPIPTALSHHVHPRAPYFLRQPELAGRMSAVQRLLLQGALDDADHFRIGIASWCVQNMFFTSGRARPSWTRVSYEDLTLFPQTTVDRLAARLDLDPVANAEALARRPSGSTRFSRSDAKDFFAQGAAADRSFLVERWLKKASPEEIDFTARALDVFEIDFYRADDPYPAHVGDARQTERAGGEPALV